MIGAFSAGLFHGIGSYFQADNANSQWAFNKETGKISIAGRLAKVAAHGTAGGVTELLRGGKFGHGFVSAAGPELLHPEIGKLPGAQLQTLGAALLGGALSHATGGKFANGAVTAAFMWMFNHGRKARYGKSVYPEYNQKEEMAVYQIIDRPPEADGMVHLGYGEFQYILSVHANRVDVLFQSLDLEMSDLEWGKYLYENGDSLFYGNVSQGGFGGVAFFIHDMDPGQQKSGLGGDINYFYQGMLHAARGDSIDTMAARIMFWNNLQGSSYRYESRVRWAEFGYNHYQQRASTPRDGQ